MLQEKDYFEKYSELKILFFFDEEKKYSDEIESWNEENNIKIGLISCFVGLNRVEDETIILAKLFLFRPQFIFL